MAKVLCTASHPVDLSDGRTLAPGEVADDVDTDNPHQRGLVLDGHLLVQDGMRPRVRKTDDVNGESDKNEKE